MAETGGVAVPMGQVPAMPKRGVEGDAMGDRVAGTATAKRGENPQRKVAG